MSSNKHDSEAEDFDKTYEENEIGLKGIFGFAIGLVLLIVITFGLMYLFLNALKDNNKDTAGPVNPVGMTETERLPAEPRLQLAPGFGIESDKGRVNLELMAPSAEYKEFHRQWEQVWKFGRKDEKSGMLSVMPLDMAKEKFLAQNVKAKSGPDAEALYNEARMVVTDASAGRLDASKRR